MPKSLGAAKPLPSHTEHVRLTVDDTAGGILNVPFQMIMLAISRALRHFVPPFHATGRSTATPVTKGKTNYTPMVDDAKSGFLKQEADNAYHRLQQGVEAFRPAFSCNDKVNMPHTTAGTAAS